MPRVERAAALVPVPNLQPKSKCIVSVPLTRDRDGHDTAFIPLMNDNVIDWSQDGDSFRDLVINDLEGTVLPACATKSRMK